MHSPLSWGTTPSDTKPVGTQKAIFDMLFDPWPNAHNGTASRAEPAIAVLLGVVQHSVVIAMPSERQ